MRDYGIDISHELPNMSWRRFIVLVRGLNPYGSYVSNYEERAKQIKEQQGRDNRLNAAEQSFWDRVTAFRPR